MSKKLKKLEKAFIAVDAVIFSLFNNDLKILLIKRKFKPFKNKWALPGGRILKNEPLEKGLKRELKEEIGLNKKINLEQFYTFTDPNRDPRGRVISVAYLGFINNQITLKPSSDVKEIKWFSLKKLPSLAFDHKKIINRALKHLNLSLKIK
jgi:8-oxo-dGTP diphosphatase